MSNYAFNAAITVAHGDSSPATADMHELRLHSADDGVFDLRRASIKNSFRTRFTGGMGSASNNDAHNDAHSAMTLKETPIRYPLHHRREPLLSNFIHLALLILPPRKIIE